MANKTTVWAPPNVGGVTDLWGPWQSANTAIFTTPENPMVNPHFSVQF